MTKLFPFARILTPGFLGAVTLSVCLNAQTSAQPAGRLLDVRARSGKPWCFWGERPGFRKPEWMGRLRRRYALAWLHRSRAPIWGIGRLAVQQYQKEFGSQRAYCNLPYISDLERFESAARLERRDRCERVFLYSGALIHRKGVDLL